MCIPHVCGFYAHKYEINAKLVFATTVNEVFVKPQQHNKKIDLLSFSYHFISIIIIFQTMKYFICLSLSFRRYRFLLLNRVDAIKQTIDHLWYAAKHSNNDTLHDSKVF